MSIKSDAQKVKAEIERLKKAKASATGNTANDEEYRRLIRVKASMRSDLAAHGIRWEDL